MKTHMQRMHGIEIENGAQIGGVVCNVCNKELCSKYFLRVHKHNTHGIIEEGSPLPQPRQNGDPMEGEPIFPMDAGQLKPGEISELTNRYFSHFTEVCPLCSRRFRGSKWLRSHLMADHGKAGTDKLRELEQQLVAQPKPPLSPTLKIPNGAFALNATDASYLQKQALNNLFSGDESISSTSSSKTKEYQCSYCSFSTPSYPFLFIHERSHTILGGPIPTDTAGGGGGVNAGIVLDDDDDASREPINNSSNGQSNHSESAISAKSEQKVKKQSSIGFGIAPVTAPSTISMSDIQSSTATTTPLPVVPLTSQDTATVTSGSKQHQLQNKQQKQQKIIENDYQQQQMEEPQHQQIESRNIFMEMANLTQRPTTYAVPQQIDQHMIMQSFLMEQVITDDVVDSSSTDNNNKDNLSKIRFVPSIVFLPVKERLAGKTVVSFTLTPA